MLKEFDLLVFICRAQPLHKGHEFVIREALKQSDKVLVLVGSANTARSIKNPFTYDERRKMIESVFHSYNCGFGPEVIVRPLDDYTYNDNAWIAGVQRVVSETIEDTGSLRTGPAPKIGLVGFAKDHTSYYLKMFPEWGSVNIESQHSTFNSTDIRNQFFRAAPILPDHICSEAVVKFLDEFMYTSEFKWLVKESQHVHEYKKAWKAAPFPPTFTTVDAVIIQSGHILLIDRGRELGVGLKALPGGFLDINETLLQSVLREVKEETEIKDNRGEIPGGVLQSFITKKEVFDDPGRSTRGRTITHAFLFELPNKEKLYKVKGGDDAMKADWYKIGTVPSNMFFEDHYFIMCKMLGLSM